MKSDVVRLLDGGHSPYGLVLAAQNNHGVPVQQLLAGQGRHFHFGNGIQAAQERDQLINVLVANGRFLLGGYQARIISRSGLFHAGFKYIGVQGNGRWPSFFRCRYLQGLL